MHLLPIKDLKDLSVFLVGEYYRHAGPKGPEEIFSRIDRSRGTGPRATVKKNVLHTVGRGPVPRHASVGTGNGLGRRAFFTRVGRSRGTGPRATVGEAASLLPVRDQAIPNYGLWGTRTLAGDRPPRYGRRNASPFHRRARACPSPCLGRNGKRPWPACVFHAGRALAGDRPPRYGR